MNSVVDFILANVEWIIAGSAFIISKIFDNIIRQKFFLKDFKEMVKRLEELEENQCTPEMSQSTMDKIQKNEDNIAMISKKVNENSDKIHSNDLTLVGIVKDLEHIKKNSDQNYKWLEFLVKEIRRHDKS